VPGQTLTTEAFVLERRPPSDRFEALLLFSPEHGCLRAMNRVSRKPGQASGADLFDEVGVLLESSNQGRSWFVREMRVLRRREGIGRSYDTLRFASAIAAVVGRNPGDGDSRAVVGALLRTALDALAAGGRPDVVYLKSLYVFARDEGYPVRQQWMASLGAEDRSEAARVLNTAAGGDQPSASVVTALTQSLEAYLGAETDIIIP
jgi:hypothetical protein